MADYSGWLDELSRRTGASVEQSDVDRLNSMDQPDDIKRLQDAYESQYKRRGDSGQAGSGTDSSEMTARGYGSARSETADDKQAGSGSGSGASRTTQGWLGGGGAAGGQGGSNPASSMFPDWYRTMMERQMAQAEEERAANKLRSDQLFGDLDARAKQTLNVDFTRDPAIRAQADAFSANQKRAQRSYLSDTAEAAGPYANLQGERRMANERYGATTGAFESNLIGGEVAARRNEIAQAYQMIAGMLSGDQNRTMQGNLAAMSAGQNEAGLGVQYDLGLRSNDLGMRNLGLQDWDRQMYWDMLQRGMF